MQADLLSQPGRGTRQRLVVDLKARILAGEVQPGERLPTYDAMESRYGASRATLLQVVEDLKRDGFVISQARRGLYVAATLPCRTRFGLLFEGHESNNRFWDKLATAATRPVGHEGLSAVVMRNLKDADSKEWEELRADLYAQRLGGVIFTHTPANSEAKALAARPDVAKVLIAYGSPAYPRSAQLHLGGRAFLCRALADLAARGARNIAMLMMDEHPIVAQFPGEAAAQGLRVLDTWIQGVPRRNPQYAGRLVRLWLDAIPERRPDGLIIADDNLAPHVIAGLVEQGGDAARRLAIVSHCNLPEPTRWALPMRRLGYDSRQVLAQALAMARDLSLGRTVADATIPPLFEEELSA